MSFYLGSDNNNQKIMHITNGAYDIPVLKGDAFDNTAFHSSLNYCVVEKYTGTISSYNSTADAITMSSKAYDKIYNKKQIWFYVDSSGKYVKTYANYVVYLYSRGKTEVIWGNWIGSKYLVQKGTASYGECSIYVLSITRDGNYIPSVKTSNDILVGDGKIVVNGIDMLGYSYLSSIPINTIDNKININGRFFQTVNLDIPNGDMEIFAKLGSVYMKKNGHKIFDSQTSLGMQYYTKKTISLPSTRTTYGAVKTISLGETSFNTFIILTIKNAANSSTAYSNCFLLTANQTTEQQIHNFFIKFVPNNDYMSDKIYVSTTSNSVRVRRTTSTYRGLIVSPVLTISVHTFK